VTVVCVRVCVSVHASRIVACECVWCELRSAVNCNSSSNKAGGVSWRVCVCASVRMCAAAPAGNCSNAKEGHKGFTAASVHKQLWCMMFGGILPCRLSLMVCTRFGPRATSADTCEGCWLLEGPPLFTPIAQGGPLPQQWACWLCSRLCTRATRAFGQVVSRVAALVCGWLLLPTQIATAGHSPTTACGVFVLLVLALSCITDNRCFVSGRTGIAAGSTPFAGRTADRQTDTHMTLCQGLPVALDWSVCPFN
jgi:hypothetical protein